MFLNQNLNWGPKLDEVLLCFLINVQAQLKIITVQFSIWTHLIACIPEPKSESGGYVVEEMSTIEYNRSIIIHSALFGSKWRKGGGIIFRLIFAYYSQL